MSICSFKRKKSPDGRLIKHKNRICTNGGMQKWGVNCWDTYSPVVNYMSVIAMLTLIILKEIHTNSVGFFLDYTQDNVKQIYSWNYP